MFDLMKKANDLQAVAKKAGELLDKFSKLDENNNGIPDGAELLALLQKLPALVKQEASEVLDEAEDARQKIAAVFREIAALVGEDIEAIQEKAGKDLADIQARLEKLAK